MKASLLIAALLLTLSPFARAMDADESETTSTSHSTTTRAYDSESTQSDMTNEADADQSEASQTPSRTSNEATEETRMADTRAVAAPAPVPPPAPEAAPMRDPAQPPQEARLQEAHPEVAGDLRAPSPKIFDENRRGFFELGVGPAYGAALISDSLMYNIIGSYNLNTSDRWTLKGLADIYMATGSVSSRQFNFGVGGEYYIPEIGTPTLSPYATADAGIGFARNAVDETATGLNLGAGAGFRFQVRDLNCDLQAHYSQLTANVGPSAPAIFALRGAVAF